MKSNKKNQLQVEMNYLLNHFGKEIKTTRYSRGQVNSTWLVNKKGEEIIVRFYPPFFQEKFSVETWVLGELKRYGVKTPKLLDVDTKGFATPVLFLSKLPGIPLASQKQVLGKEICSLLLSDLSKLLGDVATIPISSIGYLHSPTDVSDIAQYIKKIVCDYMGTIRTAQLLSTQQTSALEDSLGHLQILMSQKQARLTYPDLSSGNILINDSHFSGFVDWEFVMGFEPLYGFGNLLLELSSRIRVPWVNSRFVLEWFPEVLREELVLLAMLRLAELLSYLPTTRLYGISVKRSRLKHYKKAINELQYFIKF